MPSKTPKWTGKVNANSGLNVRNGAGTNYKVIKTLPKGTSVNICDTSGSWYYIKFSSSSYGYVYKTYVTKTGNVKKSVAKSALNSKNSKNNKKKPSNKSKLTKAQQLALKKKKEAELKKLQQKKKVEAYNNKIKKKSKIGNFGETIVFFSCTYEMLKSTIA